MHVAFAGPTMHLAEADTLAAPISAIAAQSVEKKLRDAAGMLRVGTTVDHFTLERELGRGGMGVVYLAHDDSLDRYVAVKAIAATNAETRARFLREARAQAKLTSPFVVHIHYIGKTGPTTTYFAMEYVDGESLEALLERTETLDSERARVLMLDVARGLEEAHAAGFIHRDIKPSNLLVDRKSGHVKIADFGLAKPIAKAAATLTEDGIVLGTPMYMPPEQILGGAVDHRTDMYALGASFWNLIAGRPPYDGDSSVMIFARHLNDPVPSLKSSSAKLDAVIERLMQKEPKDRFATYAELIAALEAAAPSFVEPAGFALRAAASAIDLTIAFTLLAFTGPVGASLYLAVLIAMQARLGQTIGKYFLRIRVERIDGSRLGIRRAALRTAIAGWLPLYYGAVLLLTQGKQGLFEGIRAAAQTDDLRGLVTAFVVQHVVFSFLYAVSLGLAAVHARKCAVHDLIVKARVVHVRAARCLV